MSTDPNPRTGIDRAGWKRFGTGNKERCQICGNRAEVTVSLSAHERTGGRNNPMLVNQKAVYCDDHGRLVFDRMLKAMRQTS